MIYMANDQRLLHQITELLAIIILVPFLLHIIIKYKLEKIDKYIIIVIIILTLLIDGYLFLTWMDSKINNTDMIRKLIRQSSRWATASRNDKNNLIAVLHANYGAGYLWSLKDLFSDIEINKVIGSDAKRKQFEQEIIEIQDKMTKKAVKDCPQYAGTIDFLSTLAGES